MCHRAREGGREGLQVGAAIQRGWDLSRGRLGSLLFSTNSLAYVFDKFSQFGGYWLKGLSRVRSLLIGSRSLLLISNEARHGSGEHLVMNQGAVAAERIVWDGEGRGSVQRSCTGRSGNRKLNGRRLKGTLVSKQKHLIKQRCREIVDKQ